MSTLLLRCEGPMQSWGTHSRFGIRDTERTPSKSGIVGLLAAAAGRPREASLEDLVGFRMGVRIDRAGAREVDYQTALTVAKASGATPDTTQSWRHYLADASFLVGLEWDRATLERFATWLRAPKWALYLGRRGYVPSVPLVPPQAAIVDLPLAEALTTTWPGPVRGEVPARLEALIESLPGEDGDVHNDVPLSFVSSDRRYTSRRVKATWLARPVEAPCT